MNKIFCKESVFVLDEADKSCVFKWLNPLMKLGSKKELRIEDLYQALPDDETEKLGLRLQKEWETELEKLTTSSKHPNKSGMNPSFARAIFRAFGPGYMALSIAALVSECVIKIGQPLCLGQLINYFDPESQMPAWEAYLYATGVTLGSLLFSITMQPYFFECYHYGMKLRIAACYLVYQKCLRLNQKALSETSTGQIVNIISNDVSRFDSSAIYPHYLIIGPLQAIITGVILYFYVIGPSCLAGMAILILFAPFQTWMGRIFSELRLKTAIKTDKRISTMSEIISGMRVIKMYTWEKPFASLIDLYRRMEVAVIRRTSIYRAINSSLYFISSKLIIFITFVVYVLNGNALTAEKVFLTVALFDNIRIGMTWYFPAGIAALAEGLISVQRIQNLLLLSEKSLEETLESQRASLIGNSKIKCKNTTVKWPSASTDGKEDDGNTLTDISFTVKPGQLTAIIGHVGSGKSSLLHLILGELVPTVGSCKVKGRISYASQEPWIFSATIRQNILCGSNYDAERYKRVIKASALDKDFILLPQGDQTAVGEKGTSLSGGQKARVNLARCLYVDADIYLLDDPLSAVDTHVGRHLFDQAINGFLRDKIRVLVTHQLQYLESVDKILVLKGGVAQTIGTYHDLLKEGFDLNKSTDVEQVIENLSNTVEKGILSTLDTEDHSRSRSQSKLSVQKRRSSSTVSRTSIQVTERVFESESHELGSVGFSIYWQYLYSGGGYISFIFLIFFFLGAQVFYSGSDYWLNIWTNAEQMNSSRSNTSSWQEDLDTSVGIYVYSILISCLFLFSIARGIHFFLICMISSIRLHNRMFKALIRAPLSFFDINPIGRVLNRFTRDIGCIDEQIPPTFFDVISIFLNLLGIVVVIGLVNLWLILPIVILSILFYKLSQIYFGTARNIKRLESTTRSPVFTHISSSLSGLTTIRAHKCGAVFQRVFNQCQNVHSSAYYLYIATARWFGIQMNAVTILYVACVTYTCTVLQGVITGSEAGLAISSAMSLTGALQWGVRQAADTENLMTSVERVIEYGKLPPEAPLQSTDDKKPEVKWPREGTIQFSAMSLRYKESDKSVLNQINCTIQSKEKIGIVGRTGAGKSSLITAIFRLTEPDGQIIIDGIDTKSIGLHDLRSKISIIPQDPVLFSGTMKKNVDPFGEYDDQIIWNALEDVKIKDLITTDLQAGLEYVITEGGSNLSVGERQLVCLARAILRRNKILILDEATANVDQKTDALIQLTIRDKFKDCTVLTIAHRLNTIMDSDKVMVMDAGCLKEFDDPVTLLSNQESLFSRLVEQTGIESASDLIELANQAALKRNEMNSLNKT